MTAEEVTKVLNIFDELVDQNYGYEDNIGQDVQNNRIYEETARRYNELQQSKEQPVCKEKPDIVAQLKHHLETTPKEQLQKEWDDLKGWGKIGPTVDEFLYGKPVCEGLEDAAIAYSTEDDGWNPDGTEKTQVIQEEVDAFKAGAEWMREKMMKEAVEGHVSTNGMGNKYLFPNYNDDFKDINDGDKVRIIIVKED